MNPTYMERQWGKMAPTYENISIRKFEKYLLNHCTDKPFLYLR